MKRANFKGFTLAEVLITLGIIGIVAAMTIPTLVNNYQKQEYVTALKKFYTTTNTALKAMAADNGCPGDLSCMKETGTYELENQFASYFKVAKNCQKSIVAGCFTTETPDHYEPTSGESVAHLANGYLYTFSTLDGMSVAADIYDNCTSSSPSGPFKSLCGRIIVDINGPKVPNRYGRDTFMFYLTNGTGPMLYPEGGQIANGIGESWWKNDNGCTSTNTKGTACAGRIIEEGWQMNY